MKEDYDLREAPKSTWEYFTQTKETWQIFCWVWKDLISPLSRRYAKLMFWALLVLASLQMVSPITMQWIVNGLVAKNVNLVALGFGGLIFLNVSIRLLDYLFEYYGEVLIAHVSGEVDQSITKLLFAKSMGQHLQEDSSLCQANIENGRSKAKMMIEMLMSYGIDVTIKILLSFVLLCFISPVAGIMIGIFAFIHFCWSIHLNRMIVVKYTPIERERRRLNRHMVERWEAIDRVKTNGKESAELGFMGDWTQRFINSDLDFQNWYRFFATLRGSVTMVGLLITVAYGIWLVWKGEWTVGNLFPLVNWASIVTGNMWQLGSLERRFNRNVPSVKAMKDALTIAPDVTYAPNAPVMCHKSPIRVAFEGVSYTYSGSGLDGEESAQSSLRVIQGVSFEVEAGQKVALIGSSGVGKTTIMRLLLRYADPDAGCIYVNGYKLSEVNLESWMRLVGYIPQHPQVFDGTIRYNLTYGLTEQERQKITDDELWRIMKLLQIDFGARLTDGLDTLVGRNGIKLSGGQAQRLMIGAAAIKRPLFMVIDEATSSLDSTTEKLVHDGLVQVLSGNVSALVIAHRLSTVRDLCDKFVVLRESTCLTGNDSQVEATASTFEELYRISPTFRRLADDQGINI